MTTTDKQAIERMKNDQIKKKLARAEKLIDSLYKSDIQLHHAKMIRDYLNGK